MGLKDQNVRNLLRGADYEKAIDRMEKIDSKDGNRHENWKEQIISDVIVLVIFIGLVIFIFTR